MDRKMVINGGAGFIGSNLAEAPAVENEPLLRQAREPEDIDARLVKGSILDLELLKSAFQDADCVFHQSAIASVLRSLQDPLWTGKVGTEGTLKVLVAAQRCGREKSGLRLLGCGVR